MIRGLCFGFLLCSTAWTRDEDPPPRQKTGPDELRFKMMDGSALLGVINEKELKVRTQYGMLKIPVGDICSFTPGLDSKPMLSRRIATLIQRLGSENVDEREESQKTLASMGLPVRDEIRRVREDPNLERRGRIEKILEFFKGQKEALALEDPACLPKAWVSEDVLVSESFTMRGDMTPKAFEITTRYGRMKLRLSEIDTVERVRSGVKGVDRRFRVTTEHIAQKNFTNTGILLDPGEEVCVTAGGLILMTPWGKDKVSTPEGSATYGWYDQNNQIHAGTLVARIGCDGKIFKIGTKKTFTVIKRGTLQFAIGMNPSYLNYFYPGRYRIQVKTR